MSENTSLAGGDSVVTNCEGCGEVGVYFGKLCSDCLQKAHDQYLNPKDMIHDFRKWVLKKHGVIIKKEYVEEWIKALLSARFWMKDHKEQRRCAKEL